LFEEVGNLDSKPIKENFATFFEILDFSIGVLGRARVIPAVPNGDP
jgi:hypothetical protein